MSASDIPRSRISLRSGYTPGIAAGCTLVLAQAADLARLKAAAL
jgi:hypothetical protein